MAQEDSRVNARVGPYLVGASLGTPGPGLGHLYEAWHTETGAPVLLLFPSQDVDWRPDGPWCVQLFCEPEWSAVAIELPQSPSPPDASDLSNLLVLSSETVTRLDDNPRLKAHLASPPREPAQALSPRVRRTRASRREMALAGFAVLSAGVSLWMAVARWTGGSLDASHPASDESSFAWVLGNSKTPDAEPLAYPMPVKPFQNQAVAPCYPELDEVEINGGCWFTVERRPPCLQKVQAEYKDKCYLPVSKDRGDKPKRSSTP